MGDDDSSTTYTLGLSPLNVAVIGAASSITILVIYYFCLLRRRSSNFHHNFTFTRRREPPPPENFPASVDNSAVELLDSYVYGVEVSSMSKTQDRTCAVCLSEFVDGEPVRVLPGCMHPFHVACIDMWLFSHTTCPLCRTAAAGLCLADSRSEDCRLLPAAGGGGALVDSV